MGAQATPVVIFLPITQAERGEDGVVVDPVCGRALLEDAVVGRLLHRGRYHYFCSLRCAERFAAEPGDFGPA